jgi:biotin carboxyl carrier protein
MANTKYPSKDKKKPKHLKRRVLLPTAGLIIIIAAIAGLELSDTTHWFHSAKAPAAQHTASQPSGPANAVQENKQAGSSAPSTSPSPAVPSSNDTKITSPTPANVKLLAPRGTFANEYDVGEGQQMSSTCNTNSGVYCKIVFTKDGVSKSLPKRLTDASGNASWAWKPKDIGLTPGTWHIKAIATYQSQTKTTSNDPLTLKVRS